MNQNIFRFFWIMSLVLHSLLGHAEPDAPVPSCTDIAKVRQMGDELLVKYFCLISFDPKKLSPDDMGRHGFTKKCSSLIDDFYDGTLNRGELISELNRDYPGHPAVVVNRDELLKYQKMVAHFVEVQTGNFLIHGFMDFYGQKMVGEVLGRALFEFAIVDAAAGWNAGCGGTNELAYYVNKDGHCQLERDFNTKLVPFLKMNLANQFLALNRINNPKSCDTFFAIYDWAKDMVFTYDLSLNQKHIMQSPVISHPFNLTPRTLNMCPK